MPTSEPGLPPEVRRLSGLYKIIPPDRFDELGIRAEDVPMGTFPAEDHPPYLPDRYKGNAYGLGFYEQNSLSETESAFLESIDLTDPGQVRDNLPSINAVFKRLGLLIRYSSLGRPFYLIPRQFVAHFLVEVQAKADEIVAFLRGLLSRRLRESLRVGVVSRDSDLILPELAARMPQVDFTFIGTLAALARRPRRRYDALVLLGDPRDFAEPPVVTPDAPPAETRRQIEALGLFVAGRLYDLLQDDGEIIAVCDRPVSSSRDTVVVEFKYEEDRKRFLLFSHIFSTRRRYQSGEGSQMAINRCDFHSFLSGLGLYHESMESMLGGRSLDQVEAAEIDVLGHQSIPMPRGSTPQLLGAWRRWFKPFFFPHRLETALAEVQRLAWRERLVMDGEPPDNLVIYQGRRRPGDLSLSSLESSLRRQHMAGCDRTLLAPYKDSFNYVLRVLGVLEEVRAGTYSGLPGPELARLRQPFETSIKHRQLVDVLELMSMSDGLVRMREALNPGGLLGPRTRVLANLEKLSLLGMDTKVLVQLYLIVLGHSTMSRVTFGKLSETTLNPLSDIRRYAGLQEAVAVLRLYRLMSVAETAAAASKPLTSEHLGEFFTLMDHAVQVASRPGMQWADILDEEISRLGGVQAKAVRKMLKLLDLYDYLSSWQDIVAAGEHERETRAGFDEAKLADINRVVELVEQVGRFVDQYYAGDSSARPFFFRALLNSELHGTGRLLKHLGPTATFTLLWICVHVGERRLINFNPLLQVERDVDLPRRLEMLRRALKAMTPQHLTPGWLLRLREAVRTKGEAYVRDSGLHLTADPVTGSLMAGFVDPEEELQRLGEEVGRAVAKELAEVSAADLASMDRRAYDLGRFLAAWRRSRGLSSASVARRQGLEDRLSRADEWLEKYLLDQLADPLHFAPNLWRLVRYSPQRLNRWLPHPVHSEQTKRRLSAAGKLGALFELRLDYFQDMQLSHQTALTEFGPNTAGIVGVSQSQFDRLAGSLQRLGNSRRNLHLLIMLAVLLYDETPRETDRRSIPGRLLKILRLGQGPRDDLEFILAHHPVLGQIVSGEASLAALQPIIDRQDPDLAEALFLMGLAAFASGREGLLSEDMMERLFGLQRTLRRLTAEQTPAPQAQQAHIDQHAVSALAFRNYRQAQDEDDRTVSLRRLLQTTELPREPVARSEALDQGRLQAGLERLLKLRGLTFVGALDLLMLRRSVPVPFIYSLKGLRSMGATHFERDLYEGLRLFRGLQKLPQPQQHFFLRALSEPERPLLLRGFSRAVERLTYPNQARLLLLGLAGLREVRGRGAGASVVDFLPLARVVETRFEMVNEAISKLNPAKLPDHTGGVADFMGAGEGLSLRLEPGDRVLSITVIDPRRVESKIRALRQAEDSEKLKLLYHRELKRLKLTAYDTLDYQQRLEAAFNESLTRLGQAMLERVRREMSREENFAQLEALYFEAREEGMELPVSEAHLQTLGDLYELNLDRLREDLLAEVAEALSEAVDLERLDELWSAVKARLADQHRFFGAASLLALSRRFDQRAEELRKEPS